jgi:hypothetical protein
MHYESLEHPPLLGVVKIAGTLVGKSGEWWGIQGKTIKRVSPEKSGE